MPRTTIAAFAALMLVVSGAFGALDATATPLPIAPGETVVVCWEDLAFICYRPLEGRLVVVGVLRMDGDTEPNPPEPPAPRKVSAVFLIEEQSQRTAVHARIMDDPVWQAAAIAKGLTFHIEDKDHPSVKDLLPAVSIPLPVVCSVDGDGKPVAVVPLPATIEDMRTLIGRLK